MCLHAANTLACCWCLASLQLHMPCHADLTLTSMLARVRVPMQAEAFTGGCKPQEAELIGQQAAQAAFDKYSGGLGAPSSPPPALPVRCSSGTLAPVCACSRLPLLRALLLLPFNE